MKTENKKVEEEKDFVCCALCDNTLYDIKYGSDVLERGWYRVDVIDRHFDVVNRKYICENCFEKYFMKIKIDLE